MIRAANLRGREGAPYPRLGGLRRRHPGHSVAWAGSLGWATLLIGFVLLEVVVLGCNRGRCPLTNVAAQSTAVRTPNFDIYLPRVLAQWNKALFGAIYLAAVLYTLWLWS